MVLESFRYGLVFLCLAGQRTNQLWACRMELLLSWTVSTTWGEGQSGAGPRRVFLSRSEYGCGRDGKWPHLSFLSGVRYCHKSERKTFKPFVLKTIITHGSLNIFWWTWGYVLSPLYALFSPVNETKHTLLIPIPFRYEKRELNFFF